MLFSQRTRLPAVLALAAVLTVWAGIPSLAQADSSTEVIGDDQRDVFVGTGSLLLPARISTPGRSSAADCPGCSWRAVLTCDRTSAGACRGAARTCPMDSAWLTLYLTRPGQDEQWLGSACFGPGGPHAGQRWKQGSTNDSNKQCLRSHRRCLRPATPWSPSRFDSPPVNQEHL